MSEFFQALLHYQFLQYALIAGVLAAIGCGLMGPYVVVRRIGFIAGGIAHSVLGGMGVALYFGADPLVGALVAAVLSALLIGWVRLHWNTGEDILIGALWAIGILFISRIPGYQADLVSYLFGNILLVPERELWFMGALDAILLLVVLVWHRQILAVVFDEEYARLRGLPVTFLYLLLLLVLIALTVVLLIHVVGLILVLALLTLPAAVAGQHVHSVARMMAIATLLSIFLVVAWLAMSYGPNLPPGPAIVLLAGLAYLVSTLFSRRRRWT
ncbi:metal ABC transporter permease [endosymbiont of unidentified scaly snail isolate Monju]|uniref:metal ABC transporter permease n=1 Tax=endosymbiont of unidentified scaly snail isolate Monju TaxID=1248727 RepID=UPI0003892185|nr:metal ABC transporter permease [endosymbiont of unidentified scaly snail isolate Monju]BAN68633.1 zinc transport system permease protein [endosymbiont of unidentified scaly snail isolate Monju]